MKKRRNMDKENEDMMKKVTDFMKAAFCVDGNIRLAKKDELKIKAAVELNDSKRGKFYVGVLEKRE